MARRWKYLLLSSVMMVTTFSIHAQNVKGIVRDSMLQPIEGVNITLLDSLGRVLFFTTTNTSGHFDIQCPREFVSKINTVSASLLGYRSFSSSVDWENTMSIILFKDYLPLKEVRVLRQNIFERNGDTLTFNVNHFQSEDDRAIGDVLKRIPGIRIETDGKILYNGKPIKNLYIDGDNLLDDRYNIATEGIPDKIVEKIQIIEHDQPIKVFSGIVRSEAASINLLLKQNAHSLIQNISAGITSSADHFLEDYLMLFKKQVKFLNSAKANNVGIDLEDEITEHNLTDYIRSLQYQLPNPQINLKQFSYPPISKEKYNFNNDILFNGNILWKGRKQTLFKVNFDFLRRKETDKLYEIKRFILPLDTFSYFTDTRFRESLSLVNAKLNVTYNTPTKYIVNSTEMKLGFTHQGAYINNQNDLLSEKSRISNTTLQNDFNWIKRMKNQFIFEANSFNSFYIIPGSVNISPGIFPGTFNHNKPYTASIQNSTTQAFFSYSNLNVRKVRKNGSTVLKFYSVYKKEPFRSQFVIEQLNNEKILGDSNYQNHVLYSIYQLKIALSHSQTIGKLYYEISLPLSYLILYSSNRTFPDLRNKLWIPEPNIELKLRAGQNSTISLSLRYNSSVPEASQVFDGYQLRNYRSMYANFLPPSFSKRRSATASYAFKNYVGLLFFNSSLGIVKARPGEILYRTIDSAGFQFYGYNKYTNDFTNYFLATTISKYFFKFKTTASLNILLLRNSIAQLQNNALLHFINTSANADVHLTTRFSEWLNAIYRFHFVISNSINSDVGKNKSVPTTFTDHGIEVHALLNSKIVSILSVDSYFQKGNIEKYGNNIFFTLSLSYKFNKSKTEVQISGNNLFNEKNYYYYSNSNNIIEYSSFRLRPASVSVLFRFRF